MKKEEGKVKKNNWFKQFMIFLLVIVVAVSLGLIIFYFTQDGEKVEKNQTKVQVNATESFTVEITQKKYKSSTTINAVFDKEALSIPENGITVRTSGKDKITTYKFDANASTGDYKSGTYSLVFETNAKDKASQRLEVEVVIADGSSEHPLFLASAQQLQSIGSEESTLYGSDKNYEITQDIDLSKLNVEGENNSWSPIANFSGTLNGNGKTISNLYIDAKDLEDEQTNLGLFANLTTSARVYNIKFENSTIISNEKAVNAGVVAGQSSGKIERIQLSADGQTKIEVGTLTKGANDADVYSLNSSVKVGAIAGVLKRNGSFTSIDRVAVPSNVRILVASSATTDSYVGGIVGLNQNGTIMNSYSQNLVDVKGENVYAAGIVGKAESLRELVSATQAVTTQQKANVINSYTTAVVKSNQSKESGRIAAVVAVNKNLGVWKANNGENRVYTTTLEDGAVKTAVTNAGVNADKIGYKITNLVVPYKFDTESPDSEQILYENRYVGVYYKYNQNAETNQLEWLPEHSATFMPQDAVNGQIYTLVKGADSFVQNDFKTYGFNQPKTEQIESSWDFDNIWQGGSTYPTLRMDKEYTTVLDVYDPQSAFDGTISTAAEFIALNGQEGNYRLSADIVLPKDYEPIVLKGNLYGDGHTITLADDNKNFTGVFESIGWIEDNVVHKVLVENLTIKANINSANLAKANYNGFGILAHRNLGNVRNVVITESNITLDKGTIFASYMGAMVGLNGGTIENSRVESTTVTLTGDYNSYVGFVAGYSSGAIVKTESYKDNVLTATDKSSIFNAGLIAGEMTFSSRIEKSKAAGTIILATDGVNYVGGVVAYADQRASVSEVLVENANLTGNIVGGIAGYVNVTQTNNNESADFASIVQINSTTEMKGQNVGGLAGILHRGIILDSITYATLTTAGIESATVSGYAYKIEGSTDMDGDGETAQVNRVFASTILNNVSGTAYNETYSKVRKSGEDNIVSGWFQNRLMKAFDSKKNPYWNKVAGYVYDSYFNSDLMKGENQDNSYTTKSPWGDLTAQECTNKDNFEGYDTVTVWKFVNDEQGTPQMPVLYAVTGDQFNSYFKVVVDPIEPETDEGSEGQE